MYYYVRYYLVSLKNMKRFTKFAILIVLLVGLLFLGWYYASGKFLKKIVVGPKWVNQAQYAGLFVAKDRGLYRNNGLNVEIHEFGFETNTIDDLIKGVVDVAYTTPEELLIAIDQGAPLVAVASFYQVSPMTVVSLVGSSVETPADFKGKILGNKGGTVEEDVLYGLMLKSVGLTEKDATIKKIGFDMKELDDLKLKSADIIDLYRTDQLYFFNREKIKYNLIYPERFGINSFTDIMVVRKDWLKENGSSLKAFLRATIDGWKLAIIDPESAVMTTLKYVTAKDYKDFDYEKFILEQSIPLVKPTTESSIGVMETAKWEKLQTVLMKSGYVRNHKEMGAVFTNDYLP